MIIIGPFNSFHVEEISSLFKDKNIPYEITQDPQALEKIHQRDRQRTLTRDR